MQQSQGKAWCGPDRRECAEISFTTLKPRRFVFLTYLILSGVGPALFLLGSKSLYYIIAWRFHDLPQARPFGDECAAPTLNPKPATSLCESTLFSGVFVTTIYKPDNRSVPISNQDDLPSSPQSCHIHPPSRHTRTRLSLTLLFLWCTPLAPLDNPTSLVSAL